MCARGLGRGPHKAVRVALLRCLPLSLQSRSSVQQGDLDGARRLGRLARMLSITFIIMGILIIVVAVTVNFAGEDSQGCGLAPGAGAVGGREEPTGSTTYPGTPRKAAQSPAAAG